MKSLFSRSNSRLHYITHLILVVTFLTNEFPSVSSSRLNEKESVYRSDIRGMAQNKPLDDVTTSFNVFAYQCAIEYPHERVDDIIYPGDNLGICVETRHPETYIDGIRDLELLQNDGFGGIFSTDPILAESNNAMTASDCTLENNIGKENSKCFIKTSMISVFFESELIVNVTGEVNLRTTTKPSETRELDATSGSSITSEFVIQANVGKIGDSHTVKKAVLAGALALYFIYTAIKCFCCVAVKKIYKKSKIRRKENAENVDNAAGGDIELNESSNCIV